MASTLVQNYLHVIFHVKLTSAPLLTVDLERIFNYLSGVSRGLGAVPISIGGIENHVHMLISLPKTMSISEFSMKIKAESSRWLKSLSPHYVAFAWQDGYGAFSVSASGIEKAKAYILNQAVHHKGLSFEEEYKKLLNAYNVNYDERYVFAD